jgi:hypothetical protein
MQPLLLALSLLLLLSSLFIHPLNLLPSSAFFFFLLFLPSEPIKLVKFSSLLSKPLLLNEEIFGRRLEGKKNRGTAKFSYCPSTISTQLQTLVV